MPELTKITHLIIDMDGVLYLGDKPMPRLVDFFNFLRQHSIQFILATNNSTRTPQEYVDKLAGMGVVYLRMRSWFQVRQQLDSWLTSIPKERVCMSLACQHSNKQ